MGEIKGGKLVGVVGKFESEEVRDKYFGGMKNELGENGVEVVFVMGTAGVLIAENIRFTMGQGFVHEKTRFLLAIGMLWQIYEEKVRPELEVGHTVFWDYMQIIAEQGLNEERLNEYAKAIGYFATVLNLNPDLVLRIDQTPDLPFSDRNQEMVEWLAKKLKVD